MNFRKISLLLLANLVGLSLMAEGYQLNSQSTRQIGMGHIGTALRLGSESMVFNPAGLSFMKSSTELSLGATGIISKVNYTSGSYSVDSDSPIGTPLFIYAATSISDKFFAGISVTNPAGNSLVWPDNWSGSHLVQNITLKTFAIQPTISYKISDQWSIGAGLTINLGSFNLNKGMVPVGALTPYLGVAGFPQNLKDIITATQELSPLNINLAGNADFALGVNVGILFTPSDDWSIGLSYRSKVKMSVSSGLASVDYGASSLSAVFSALTGDPTSPLFNAQLAGALSLDKANFSAELPIPSNLQFGVAFKPSCNLLLSAELQYVGWKAYDKLVIDFGNPLFNSVQQKNFTNSMIYRVGGEYYPTDKVTLRAGLIYDTTPVDLTLYSPETPGANKISATAGLSLNFSQKVALDLAVQYLNGALTEGSVPVSPTETFSGQYKSKALLPSLGLRLSF
ncbi:MAG: outer membrane protein transport protein [Bacteroidales bacterium]